MKRRDLRLLPLAVGVWAAALLCVYQPSAAVPCAAGCAGAALIGAIVVAWRQRSRGVVVRGGLAIVLLAAAAATAASAGFASAARSQAAASDGRIVEVTAEITSSASIGRDGRLWFEAQTAEAGPPGAVVPLSAPVRIGVVPVDGYDLGARIHVVGEAKATDSGERTALVVFASTADVVRPASGVFGVAASIRHAFVERSRRLPEPGAGLLPGLAVGDTRAVSDTLSADMRTSGLSHLTAVSGANCAIVVGAVFWLTALCGGGRVLRVCLAGLGLAGFVVLVTPEPSVVRAAAMAGVAMLTVLLGRPSAGAGMLALCASGILIADPWLAAAPGFALSVAASGALILLAPPLSRGMSRWLPAPLALAIAVPLAAQLACAPIIAMFAEQQSVIGVAANLLAGPAAPIATVIGLLACLTAALPLLADLLAVSAWLPAAWIATTATTSARLPVAQILLPPGMGSAVLVALVSAAIAIVVLRPRRQGAVLLRVAAGTLLIVIAALGAARALIAGPLAAATTPDTWAIAACNVGQGDALLVRSAGMIALIDTGPDPEPLAACLGSLGIDHVDLLVLTHFDLDHRGGLAAVHGKVSAVLHSPPAGADDQRVLDDLAAGGARVMDAAAGQHGTLGSATWRVLWPLPRSVAFGSGNDASVVIEFDGGGVPRSLFLGDLSASAQRMLQRTAHPSGYAVVKVAHHGSADQDPGLYEALRTKVALFSAGVDNDYGHPREETLDLLTATGAHNLRTDQQGRILLGLKGGGVEVWTESNVERRR